MESKKYLYGGKAADVNDAAGVSGVLCKGIDNRFFFRVYEGENFTDYDICHNDIAITIAKDELAAFYTIGETHVLDHSPQVLGLKTVDS